MKEKNKLQKELLNYVDSKEPVYKGCLAAENGGCMCTGACKEIIGWKDKPKQNEWDNKGS